MRSDAPADVGMGDEAGLLESDPVRLKRTRWMRFGGMPKSQ